MGEMYGHTWASQQGDEPNDTWIRGLDGVSNEQLAVGLRACLERAGTFPPTLPEFRAMCLGTDDGFQFSGETACHRIVDRSAMIEDKTAKEKRADEGLANIRKLREEVGL